jgi:type II secretory pathway component HofQ
MRAMLVAMRVSMVVVGISCACAIAGCGGAEPTRSSSASIADWTSGEDEDTRPRSRTIDGRDERATPSADERPPSRTLGGSSARDRGVVRRGALVDVGFDGAELREVMRLLAEVAGVDVIVEDGVSGTVTIDLRDVRPLDAMGAIAEAHGATLELSGRMAIVRPAR